MRRFVIFCCLIVFCCTCTKEYFNPVPKSRVYIEVDLVFRDKELQAYASSKIFTSNNTIHGKELTGYAGVLVTRSLFGEYKAFDIACPYEVQMGAVVEINNENNAVCNVCGSTFEVMLNYASGGCIGGPSKYALRPYNVFIKDVDKTLIIRDY